MGNARKNPDPAPEKAARRPARPAKTQAQNEKRHARHPNFVKEGRMWVFSPEKPPAPPAEAPPDPKEAHRLERMRYKTGGAE